MTPGTYINVFWLIDLWVVLVIFWVCDMHRITSCDVIRALLRPYGSLSLIFGWTRSLPHLFSPFFTFPSPTTFPPLPLEVAYALIRLWMSYRNSYVTSSVPMIDIFLHVLVRIKPHLLSFHNSSLTVHVDTQFNSQCWKIIYFSTQEKKHFKGYNVTTVTSSGQVTS